MYLSRLTIKQGLPIISYNRRSLGVLIKDNEYTQFPEYPPISDIGQEAVKLRVKQEWHSKIRSLNTVEEKLFAINVPKYYGWHSLMLREGIIPYNSLPLTQFLTRTHFIESLPQYYSESNVEESSSKVLSEVKSSVEDALIIGHNYQREKYKNLPEDVKSNLSSAQLENIIGTSIIQQINRILLSHLSSSQPHLLETQIDFEPRVESFWFVGQIDPPAVVRRSKEKVDRLKENANDPIDRAVQYIGSPVLQLRSKTPLSQFVELKDYDESDLPVPSFTYDPRVLGAEFDYRHGTTIPGFWPGDSSEFGLVSYHNRGHITDRPPHYDDVDQCLQAQAILASYSWTLSQACYQGFSTFNELTYPLVSQTVITNGQSWSFYAYQLNTTLLHSENASSNARRNICWGLSEAKLFESIEGDKIVGFNEDVLKTLIKFYLNEPKERLGVNMQPHLGLGERYVADIADDERRNWLESQFKHMYSNRPRHRMPYEVYNWERIYKIDHNTRPLDKKTRPFELMTQPYRRKFSEHTPKYIPKKFRPEDKKHKKKWSKTFYPSS